MRGLPHLQELVQLHKDDPFALVGIATDPNLQDYTTKAKAAGVTWRNAWAGGTTGVWPTTWGVQRYPTVYVLDARGVVRFVDVRGEALSTAVRTLIAEQRTAKPAPSK